jgi:nucleotide-binding universal stress UspA family protein
MSLPKCILVPIDFSPATDTALDFAVALAREGRASLVLLHVWEPPIEWLRAVADVDTLDALMPFSASSAGTRMREYLAKVEAEGIAVSGCVEHGDRARAITRYAESTRCDLIVIGAHDATSRSWLIGLHVSDRVVRNAHCPVIVVHATPPATHGEPMPEQTQTAREYRHGHHPQHPQR